jgi:hypothetical protein
MFNPCLCGEIKEITMGINPSIYRSIAARNSNFQVGAAKQATLSIDLLILLPCCKTTLHFYHFRFPRF